METVRRDNKKNHNNDSLLALDVCKYDLRSLLFHMSYQKLSAVCLQLYVYYYFCKQSYRADPTGPLLLEIVTGKWRTIFQFKILLIFYL